MKPASAIQTLSVRFAKWAGWLTFVDEYVVDKFLGKHSLDIVVVGPPRLPQLFLLLLPRRNREHIVGDLEEEFRTIVLPQHGRFLARSWYFEQVIFALGFYLWPVIKKILGLSVLYKRTER